MFKVGDKVAFRTNLEVNKKYGNIQLLELMMRTINKNPIVTIDKISPGNYIGIKECKYDFTYSTEMFVPCNKESLFDLLVSGQLSESEYERNIACLRNMSKES